MVCQICMILTNGELSKTNDVTLAMFNLTHGHIISTQNKAWRIQLLKKAEWHVGKNITFMTDCQLIDRLIYKPNYLSNVAAVVVDKVHERSLNTDILLCVLKNHAMKNPNFFIVLISAYPYQDKLLKYFGQNCQVLDTTYNCVRAPKPVHCCEQYEEINTPTKQEYIYAAVNKTIEILTQTTDGDILVFLVTLSDIQKARCLMTKYKEDVNVIALQDQESSTNTALILHDSHKVAVKRRHIILTTNVAEPLMVVIHNVKYVVDCGYTKYSIYDPISETERESIDLISRVSADLRKRKITTEGGCMYRMYTKTTYETQMCEQHIPNILRCDLSSTVLKLLALRRGIWFDDFVDQPAKQAVELAVETLKKVGALTSDGREITKPIGFTHMIMSLPPDWVNFVLMAMTVDFTYWFETVAIAVYATLGSFIFITSSKHLTDRKKFYHAGGDVFIFLIVFRQFICLPDDKILAWCRQNGLIHKTLQQIWNRVKDIGRRIGATVSDSQIPEELLRKLLTRCFPSKLVKYTGYADFYMHVFTTKKALLSQTRQVINRYYRVHPNSSNFHHERCKNNVPALAIYLRSITATSGQEFIWGVTYIDMPSDLPGSFRSMLSDQSLHSGGLMVKAAEVSCLSKQALMPLLKCQLEVQKFLSHELTLAKSIGIAPYEKVFNVPCDLQLDMEKGTVTVFTPVKENHLVAEILWGQVEHYCLSPIDEKRVECIFNTNIGYRAVIGKGGMVHDILLSENELVDITFRYDPRHFHKESDQSEIGVDVRKYILKHLASMKVHGLYQVYVNKEANTVKVSFKTFQDLKAASEVLAEFVAQSRGIFALHCCTDQSSETVVVCSMSKPHTLNSYMWLLTWFDIPLEENLLDIVQRKVAQWLGGVTDNGSYHIIQISPYKYLLLGGLVNQTTFEMKSVSPLPPLIQGGLCGEIEYVSMQTVRFEAIQYIHGDLTKLNKHACGAAKVSWKLNEQNRIWLITVSASSLSGLNIMKMRVDDIIKPDRLPLWVSQIDELQDIIKGCGNVNVDTVADHYNNILNLYGSKNDRLLVMTTLAKVYMATDTLYKHTIPLSDLDPGVMETLLSDYGPDLLQLSVDLNLKNINIGESIGGCELDPINQLISIRGPIQAVASFKKLVESKCQRKKQRACKENKEKVVYNNTRKCSLCRSWLAYDVKTLFQLSRCGHIYCKPCILALVYSFKVKNILPITCCEQNCPRPELAIDDILAVAELNVREKNNVAILLEFSIKKFIRENTGTICVCTSPNCPGLSKLWHVGLEQENITKRCSFCDISHCLICGLQEHPKATLCYTHKISKKIDRLCQNCGALYTGLTKSTHLRCGECDVHVCWLCDGIFQTEFGFYIHHFSVHKTIEIL